MKVQIGGVFFCSSLVRHESCLPLSTTIFDSDRSLESPARVLRFQPEGPLSRQVKAKRIRGKTEKIKNFCFHSRSQVRAGREGGEILRRRPRRDQVSEDFAQMSAKPNFNCPHPSNNFSSKRASLFPTQVSVRRPLLP